MTKFLNCIACQLKKQGVKTRRPVDHTCGRYGKGYKGEPEERLIGDEYYVKVIIWKRIAVSKDGDSVLYHIKNNQWLNGYKIKSGVELWVNLRNMLTENTDLPNGVGTEKFIWLKKEIYNNLVFL